MKRILPPAIVLLAALALGGCSALTNSESSGGQAGPGVGAPAAPDEAGGGEGGSDGGDSGGEGESDADRSIVTTGTMTITAVDPLEAAAEATRIVERLGGRVDERSEFAPEGGDAGGAILTLRIPADELTGAIESLRDLGEVEHVATTASDVTREVQDLDARIEALRASHDRLLALLADATDTKVLIEIETAVSDRQAELESLEAHRRSLADAVSMSTLELTLQSEEVAPVDRPETFLDGLAAGWNAMVALGSTTLVVFGALLPWLVLGGLLALLIVWIVRLAHRRSRGAAAAAPGDGTA
ncbi:DUF4349 domain-containing protein [Lysobacter korlensis]|uniref:DUF4349 domain-containing protein n=1 Tax=Lysobacter korlensis TaxID=553636 RepID=A0ABV6RX13_9GAMM